MATVNKDFKIKSGLIVEGTTASVNGFDILTKKQADQDYIVGLIGGTATSANEANKVVKRDANGNFAAGTITATITGTVSSLSNHDTADLAEGANLYFTNARAISATAASYDVLGAAAAAQSAAATDATTKATAARTAAESFATSADTAVRTAVTTEIGTAISTEVTNRNSAISTAIATEVTNRNSAISTAVSGLVDGAPALLDTLNELAAAIGDSPDTITNLTTSIGEKLPKAGGTMSGAIAMGNNNITGVGTPSAVDHAATKGYVDGEVSSAASTASQAAADALTDANAYTDTREGLITTAYQAYADALDTDDVAEAGNQYFTDARAKASAGDLLAGATTDNVNISYVGGILSITAENGVADSTTDDLEEGETNLYFTDTRAVQAVEGISANFFSVTLNEVAKQVAATLEAPTAGVQTAHAFRHAEFRSAEYLVKVAYGTHTEISKVLLTLDTSNNIAITEYGIVGTNGSASTVSAGISGTEVQLLVTTANNNSTVTVIGTLLV